MSNQLEQGAMNCVVDCARVKKGDAVYVLNQVDAVEEDVSEAVREIAANQGAKTKIIWEKAIPKKTQAVPDSVLEAYRLGDVVISHYPSLRREVLHPYVKGDTRSRATNRATTVALLESDWARFPYSLQLTIINTIDHILSTGKKWRITSPNGTDIQGEVGGAESTVAQAYFVRGEDDNRASKNFPGGVHTPLVSASTQGVIYVDHASVSGNFPTREPLRIELNGGRVVSIQGDDEAGQIKKELEETDGFLDSWHAGTNPRTIVPCDRKNDPRMWWVYAHCSPKILHFHLGRTHAPVNVATFHQTVYIDERKIYENGLLAIVDAPEIWETAKKYGDPDKLFHHQTIDLT